MKTIGLLSDTHGCIHPRVFSFFKDCDEVWHAGDIGSTDTFNKLSAFKPLRAVFGNIDDNDIRNLTDEFLLFTIEKVKVLIIHIGGYPGKYTRKAYNLINEHNPKLFISGHSHILKVIPDNKNDLLHLNPGAAGNSGFHKVITMMKFIIDNDNIRDLEILEIDRKKAVRYQ